MGRPDQGERPARGLTLNQRRVLIEHAQDLVAAYVRHLEQHARRCPPRDRARASPASAGALNTVIDSVAGSRPAASAAWRSARAALLGSQPPRGRGNQPSQNSTTRRIGVVGLAAEQDRRMRLLLRLGVQPDRIEVDELAVKLGLLLRPQRLHRQHALAQQLEAASRSACRGSPSPRRSSRRRCAKMKRPPESWSRLATDLAVTIGSRCGIRQCRCRA